MLCIYSPRRPDLFENTLPPLSFTLGVEASDAIGYVKAETQHKEGIHAQGSFNLGPRCKQSVDLARRDQSLGQACKQPCESCTTTQSLGHVWVKRANNLWILHGEQHLCGVWVVCGSCTKDQSLRQVCKQSCELCAGRPNLNLV